MNDTGQPASARTSKLAVAALAIAVVCALFEFFPFLLIAADESACLSTQPFDTFLVLSFLMVPASVIVLILAVIAWIRIKRARGGRSGRNWAVAAIALLVIANGVFVGVWVRMLQDFKMW